MWQRAGGEEGSPLKSSSAACGTQYLSRGHLAKGHCQGTGYPGSQEQALWEPAFSGLGPSKESEQPNGQVKEEAKGRAAAEEEEWGFHGLGVMRSEFKTGCGSRRTENPEGQEDGPLLSLSLGEDGYAMHLDGASLPVGAKRRVVRWV